MKRRNTIGLIAAVAAMAPLGWAAGARADSITINNSSFENATGYWNEGYTNATYPSTSWGGSADFEKTVISGSGTPANTGGNVQTATTASSATGGFTAGVDGNNVLAITADPGTGSTASQYTFIDDLGTKPLGTYAANTTYTLTVALGVYATPGQSMRSDYIALASSGDNFTDKNANNNAGYADYAEVVPGASDTIAWNTTDFPNYQHALTDYSVTVDTSTDMSLVGQSIGAVLGEEVGSGAMYSSSAFFDNVRLTSTVDAPEPASLALLGLGGLALLGRRRSPKRA